ncbi:MAG TPA: PAS domain-containing protein [Xanthobacteraceae bacterium]|nr:PAS domain-containing protein [Xanthobacteraceae bacterium]
MARRDGNGTITYANDTFCSFAGRSREELIGTSFALPVEQQAKPQSFRTARTSTTKRSPRPMAHAGSPGVKSPCAPTPAARCKASAAM